MNTQNPLLSVFFGVMLLTTFPLTAEEKVMPVSIVRSAIAPVYEEIPLTGSVESRRVSRISPKVSGFIAEVLVDEGDEVQAGAPLLKLDPVMARLELARGKAELEEAQAQLNEAKRQRNEAAELIKKKHIAATNYETLVSQVAIREAAMQVLRTEVERQEELLKRQTVYAPFNGVIGKKLIEAGQWIETSTPLFELVELDILRIDVPVPQFYFSQIGIGAAATIRFDATPDRIMEGKVTMKIPVGQESGRVFPVRIEIQNHERLIAPGMSAHVRIHITKPGSGKAMLVPRDTIIRRPDGSSSIWIIEEKDGAHIATIVKVKTGQSYQGNIEIVAGDLKVGDKVVIRGNEILQPGQTVRITQEVELKL